MENKIATVDIETSGLLSDMVDYSSMPYKLKPDAKIWVISVCDISANKVVSLSNDEITKESVEELLRPYDTVVLQNGLSFDLPALQLFGLIDYKIGYLGERDLLNGKEVRILDTLIMSRFINPDRLGGHSLGAWGNRVGSSKTDYRGELVELGVIDKSLPKGEEFRFFHPLMVEYCEQDTIVTAHTYRELLKDYKGYTTAKMGLQLEHKLADLAVSRENLGFWFDKDLAIKNLEFLNQTMEELANNVNPILPKKKKTKTDISNFTPPKQQFKKDGTWSNHMLNFFNKMGITEYSEEDKWFKYKGNVYECPYEYPLEWEEEATIDDLDVVKHTLIDKGWIPTEWKDRDLTKDSKKQVIPIEKRRKALEKYVEETLSGKYKDQRLDILGLNEDNLLSKLSKDILGNRAVKVPTSPCIKVGVTKEMCPNLIKLGEEVSFAKEVADYYTYRHRRSAIAGGDTTELDFEDDIPETGYLAQMREEDGRIPTPAIEIGASCVVKGSLLTTSEGLKCITEVSIGDRVLTHKGVYKKVIDKIDNGVKNVFKVTLNNGMSLTCTANHPFWTTGGWVPCEQLEYETEVFCYGEKEIWSKHPVLTNYEGSTFGRVRNKRGMYMKPLLSKMSGRCYSIDFYTTEGRKTRRSVGKFIIECFKGLTPNGMEVLHNDGNSTNNNLSNLRFGTSKENSEDAKLHGYVSKIRKTRKIVLTDRQVENIRAFQQDAGLCRGQDSMLAKKYGVSREYIRDIRLGKRRTELPHESLYIEKYVISTVLSVERLGVENTYDITVEEDHSYVVNSIVTHNTHRFKHIGVANVPRVSSLFGKEMRALFGAGKGNIQFAYDFASLEARIEGHYVYPYEGGEELAVSLLAEKPNDIHSLTGIKMGIPRDQAKSVNYAILYGASANKFVKMLGMTKSEAEAFYTNYWDSNPALKQLKADKDKEWMQSGKKYITSIDGRRINIRSQHSILNALFQSAGVICAKYVNVLTAKRAEEYGLKINVFKDKPNFACMISYHDEENYLTNSEIVKFKTFKSKEEAKEFVNKWGGEQLGAIQEIKKGVFFVALPSLASKAVTGAISDVEKLFNLKVPLGIEIQCGSNWSETH